jgi:hypothetical protein
MSRLLLPTMSGNPPLLQARSIASCGATWPARATHAQLPAPRHDDPLCRARCQGWVGDRPTAPSSSRGISAISRRHRERGARRPGRSLGRRQLLDPQDRLDPAVAREAPTIPTSTSRPPARPGSTSSSGGSVCSPSASFAAAPTGVLANSKTPFEATWPKPTPIPSRSSGPRPPTRSSTASGAFACELPDQDTSRNEVC